MGIGKAKSDNIDIDGLMGNIDKEDEANKEEDCLLQKIYELKKAQRALETTASRMELATRKLSEAVVALNAAKDSADNIVTGICTAVANAQKNTVFTARLRTEDINIFRELYMEFADDEIKSLKEHREKQNNALKEHEDRIAKMLHKRRGIWLSKWWLIFFFIYFILCNMIILISFLV